MILKDKLKNKSGQYIKGYLAARIDLGIEDAKRFVEQSEESNRRFNEAYNNIMRAL